jgi:hypothetical protein
LGFNGPAPIVHRQRSFAQAAGWARSLFISQPVECLLPGQFRNGNVTGQVREEMSMKRRMLVLAVGLLAATPAWGQMSPGIPQVELFLGGSYYRAGVSNGTNLVGWQAAFDYNVYKHVSVVLDLGGAYKTSSGSTLGHYQYMIGPRFKRRAGRFTAFAEGLVGGVVDHTPLLTQGAFAAGFGGGVDMNAGRLVSIRLIQVDSIHDHMPGVWGHNIRVGTGVVFNFPRHHPF